MGTSTRTKAKTRSEDSCTSQNRTGNTNHNQTKPRTIPKATKNREMNTEAVKATTEQKKTPEGEQRQPDPEQDQYKKLKTKARLQSKITSTTTSLSVPGIRRIPSDHKRSLALLGINHIPKYNCERAGKLSLTCMTGQK